MMCHVLPFADITELIPSALKPEYSRISGQCQKLGKLSTGPINKLLLSFMVISDVYRPYFKIKLHLLSIA